ncbi:MAG TPA: hypothetical protein VH497_16100 [Vicinamibacterales bacterium]
MTGSVRPDTVSFTRKYLPAAIAACGAILLVVQWSWGRVLWLDEEMIAINIRDRSFHDLAGALSLAQAAPYGWLALERALLLTLGGGERVLRIAPMLFGVATLGGALWIGRRWMSAVGASALVFLCAFGQWVAFHALELKHYSADTCFGLLLPALAVWAVEPDARFDRYRSRRIVAWWVAAAIAQWFSNGALFVAPACAIVIVGAMMIREGLSGAVRAAAPGGLWLASFAANYAVTLGPALGSDFLRGYWASSFPPSGIGVIGTLQWCVQQLAPLADKPGGSGFGVVFWIVAAIGLFAAPGFPPAFRAIYLLVPFSAFALAAIRLVPTSERLGLWFVPALYVGVAMAAQAAAGLVSVRRARARVVRQAVGVAALVFLVVMARDVFARGRIYISLTPYESNHDFDDRSAIGWLARQRRAGDVWMAPYLSLPAIWWYAGPDASTPAVEASFDSDRSACAGRDIDSWRARGDARRALVYLGFGADSPKEFVETLVSRLTTVGSVAAYRKYQAGHALIIDLQTAQANPLTIQMLLDPAAPGAKPRESGCILITPARRW